VITVYTTQASFLAAVAAPGTDGFDGFLTTGATASPVLRTAGSYSYTASASGGFFGAGTVVNPWLSTNDAPDSITFSGFGGGARAIGANFFDSSASGSFAAGSVLLVATNSLGETLSQSILGATTSSFLGFVSTAALASLTLSAVQPAGGSLWPTVDNLTIAAIPEPETYALMLAGLAAISAIARRRMT